MALDEIKLDQICTTFTILEVSQGNPYRTVLGTIVIYSSGSALRLDGALSHREPRIDIVFRNEPNPLLSCVAAILMCLTLVALVQALNTLAGFPFDLKRLLRMGLGFDLCTLD